tara:strand:- start:814 stop:1116 length:303 start_codon:yes stop_codon:yes gene_type:complete
MDADMEYIFLEITGEGDIYLTQKHIINKYNWKENDFINFITLLSDNNVCNFYKYGETDEFLDVTLSEIDFKDKNKTNNIYFCSGKNINEFNNLSKEFKTR